ncbi:PAS domain S-box protein [Paludibacterium sp. dN 18-1]|uniref:PAS domain S-box protein n=2 Tax=Paludibacterium denitrificans TaxID=2675226 RepID=A0A844GBE6_9NEIS|nr:PAS domain S-box protein [Paludibacterium denitrificans]
MKSPGVIAMVREVSRERQAERQWQKIEARCQQVVESALDGLIMIDQHGVIVLVNPAAEAMFGYRREELIGQPLSILIPARFLPRHDDLVTAYLHCPTGRSPGQQRGIIGQRRDGSEFPAEVGLSPLHNSDGLQVLATITDMSARMAAQAQIEQSLREKTALLNEVHHRVKNNLQVISSLLNLQTRHASAETRRVMAESQNHVKAMALIHQLLYERGDFSRVHIGVYLQRLLILLHHSMNPDGQQVQLTHRGLDTPVFLDLQRAIPCGLLVNELVTNALKHAFPDGRSGNIEVVLSGSANHQAELQINDDGIGIPDHIQPGAVPTLGFQLLPMLVEQLKGQWELQRKPEGGTRISLRFTGSSHEESADDAR